MKENRLKGDLTYAWQTYNSIIAGAALRELGAGPAVWDRMRSKMTDAQFLWLVECVNVLESERAVAVADDIRRRMAER